MSDELKHCPFCGGEPYCDEQTAKRFGERTGWNFAIACSCCETVCSVGCDSFSEAVKEWNTRHVPEGYALVPVDPTKAMSVAGMKVLNQYNSWATGVYKAMIAAAQEEKTA